MRVNYLGPFVGDIHPAVKGKSRRRYPSSCYLVEVSDEAGIYRHGRKG